MLLRARARITELEAELATQRPRPVKPVLQDAWAFRLPTWSFYGLSVLVVLGAALGWHRLNPERVTAALAVITGVVTMLLVPHTNIWMLFITGFAQPLIGTAAWLLSGGITYSDLDGLLPTFFFTCLAVGLSATLGATAAALFGVRPLTAQQFGFTPFLKWMGTAESRADKVERFILKVAALTSTATLVLSKLFPAHA